MGTYKIGIITEGYPSHLNLYQNAFVHSRAKLYKKYGHHVKVFVLDRHIKNKFIYTFEGIEIIRCNSENLCKKNISAYDPDILCFHAPKIPEIMNLAYNLPAILEIPIIIWIHGQESLLYPLYYPPSLEPKLFLRWLYSSVESPIVLKRIRKLFKNIDKLDIGYTVFVSHWMKKAAEKSTGYAIKNFEIIPNPVDTTLFSYTDRSLNWKDNKNILIARNFNSSKYGIDIAIKALSSKYQKYKLHVYGKGPLLDYYKRLAYRVRSNTIIYDKFISHNDLPDLFKKYYLFLSPSRTEAQGLTMCEFMATGGPVIATKVGGIPEFVRDGVDGLLVEKNNYKEIREGIEYLLSDENIYRDFSKNARFQSENMFSHDIVITRELELIKKAINDY